MSQFISTAIRNVPSERTLKTFNDEVLWGWKRDVGKRSRAVYFSGKIVPGDRTVSVQDPYFFYRLKGPTDELERLSRIANQLIPVASQYGLDADVKLGAARAGSQVLTFQYGRPQKTDEDRTQRLSRRRPRKKIVESVLPPSADLTKFNPQEPIDLYIGSGMSYEAGLPTLCEMHEYFNVDSPSGNSFTTSENDQILNRHLNSFSTTVMGFCALHIESLVCNMPRSYHNLKSAWSQRKVGKVFSDNVDNLIARINVPFERTRGSGVFNERYPAEFSSRHLVVIGVAADRRQLIQQARGNGMKVTVVNPVQSVSFGVQHLNYIKAKDTFFQNTADDFFDHFVASEGK